MGCQNFLRDWKVFTGGYGDGQVKYGVEVLELSGVRWTASRKVTLASGNVLLYSRISQKRSGFYADQEC